MKSAWSIALIACSMVFGCAKKTQPAAEAAALPEEQGGDEQRAGEPAVPGGTVEARPGEEEEERAMPHERGGGQWGERYGEQEQMPQQAPPMQTEPAACQGMTQMMMDACPVDRANIQRVENTDGGIVIHMKRDVVASELERHVRCYEGRMSMRTTMDEACPFSLPDLTANVLEEGNRVQLRITSSNEEQVRPLRQRARALVPRARPRPQQAPQGEQ
ncbi:MAG: hypothetical protein HYY06_23720 [Deltaproteobacteria bacterium]|nr:hypothetical protein [Deltaproteobacteria bacterium]